MSELVGRRMGDFEVLAALGRGGGGEVYRARDVVLGREVALKALPSSLERDPAAVARLDREARLLAALDHPNIAVLYALGHGDLHGRGSRPFLVLELVPGEDLGRRLQAGPLAVDEALRVAAQIARALEAAHAKGIVHRDLKPGNVMVTPTGNVKVLDFGIARALGDVRRLDRGAPSDREGVEAAASGPTSGGVSGTLPYMSPEQLHHDALDPRVDVWAFGCVLYECLTGERAFGRDSRADTVAAIVESDPDWSRLPADTPAGIRELLARCLDRDPERRLQRIEGARLALEDAASGWHLAAPAPSLAVLPFATHGEPDQQYFGEGLAEELIVSLARLPGLRVASRGSAFHAGRTTRDSREIGERLHVNTVLEGSVRRSGTRLRIAVQLLDVHDGYLRWSGRWDRELVDVFAVQEEIATAIVTALEPALLGPGGPAPPVTTSLEAYELYLQGRHFWHQRSPPAVFAGIERFERAARLDPGFARAYTGIADSWSVLRAYGVVPRDVGFGKARAAVERALELGRGLPEAHVSAGFFHLHFDDHRADAEKHLRKAIEIDPRSALAHAYYGLVLALARRDDGARTQAEIVRDLDPLSPGTQALVSLILLVAHRWPGAVEAADRALALQPDHPLAAAVRGLACCKLGRFPEAIATLERLVATTSRAPVYLAMLGLAYGLTGRGDETAAIAAEVTARGGREYVSPHCELMLRIGLGDSDGVERALDRCRDDHTSALVIASTAGPFLEREVEAGEAPAPPDRRDSRADLPVTQAMPRASAGREPGPAE